VEKVRRIALVGNGATTRASDNFDGEIWTTASVAKILPSVNRVFEVHKEYDAIRLNGYGCPVMTDGRKGDLSKCEPLPIDEMVRYFGPMFQFSFDYMAAWILFEKKKPSEVVLYGIDLTTDSEYNQFRQSFFYWIGMLRGSGITVNISQGSAIFNRRWVYCHERDEIAEASVKLTGLAEKKVEEYASKEDEARMGVAYSNGYKQCAIDLGRMGA
jgi:hypothetical protein